MQNLSLQAMRTGGRRFLLWQIVITLLLVVLAYSLFNLLTAYSVLMGGAICVLANAFFVWRFFAYYGALAATKVMKAIYFAEIIKLLASVILFVIAIRYWYVKPLPFLLAYFVVHSVYWASPLIFKGKVEKIC